MRSWSDALIMKGARWSNGHVACRIDDRYGGWMGGLKNYLKQFEFVRKLNASLRGQPAAYIAPAPGAPPLSPEDVLAAVERREVEPNRSFTTLYNNAEAIEGMLSHFSMAVLDMLLTAQEAAGASGDIIEIGTYHGKSAVILGSHLRLAERLTLVDIHDYLERQAIAPFADAVDFLLTPSDRLRNVLPDYPHKHGKYRFIHIDASHGYRETFHELRMAEELLAPKGIIALDDFVNLDYSQNIAAIFKYLYTASKDLVLFLVTNEKGYLCRKADADAYLSFVFNWSLAEMQSRGVQATLAKTSIDPEYRAFYLRDRAPGEGAFYGPELYRNQLVNF